MIRISGKKMLGVIAIAAIVQFPAIAEIRFAPADHASPLTGIVRDSLGNALGEVQILVLGDAAEAAPVAIALTDERGRYLVEHLRPGSYRVAALKEGYLAFLGSVNTIVRSSLDLVLRSSPAASPGEDPAPSDSTWVLRLPARSLLRDTGAGALLVEEARDESGPFLAAVAETLEGEVAHVFAIAGPGSESAGLGSAVEGGETRVRLASPIGERGKVAVQGNRESLGRASSDLGGGSFPRTEATRVIVDVLYDTSRESSLSVKAGFEQQGLLAPSIGASQQRKAWGYDATWTRQVDAASRMAIQVGFLDASLDLPPPGEDGSPEDTVASGAVQQRSIEAEGSFESALAAGHRLRVGFLASRRDLPGTQVAIDDVAVTQGSPLHAGWGLRIKAEDEWSVSGPASVAYGLGYLHSLDGGTPSLVEPRLGGAWSVGDVTARVIFEYNLLRKGQDPILNPLAASMDGGLGFEADVEAALPFRLRLRGGVSRDPADIGRADATRQSLTPSQEPLYAPGGTVATSRDHMVLEHQSGALTTWLEWARGSAEGQLLRMLPIDVARVPVDERRMEWLEGLIGVRFLATGTSVLAEYRTVEDRPIRETAGADSVLAHRYVELRVSQDLLRATSRGLSCRLLLAARVVPGSPAPSGSDGPSDEATMLAALDHRLNAGLQVAF